MTKRAAQVPKDYDPLRFQAIVQDLENRLNKLEQSGPNVYTITNPSESRSLNVATATAAQIAAFVGTLVIDLQNAGKLGR